MRRWQGADRFYGQVQRFARGQDSSPSEEVKIVHDDLAELIESSRVTREVKTWRGNRSSVAAFGVPSDRLEELLRTEVQLDGFVAASGARSVAEHEFTRPSGQGGAVLTRMTVPRGTRAAWIAGIGDPETARQQEVLMDAPVVRYVQVNRDGPIPVLIAEVVR